jgi:hypothetical protein
MHGLWTILVTLPVLAAPFGATAAKPTPTERCLKLKRRAAGGAGRSVLACHAQAAKQGAGVSARCLAKAAARLYKGFDKADHEAAAE